jgi:hypothetical protein
MKLFVAQILMLTGCFKPFAACPISNKKLKPRYGMGIEKRFPGEIVTYLKFTVSVN